MRQVRTIQTERIPLPAFARIRNELREKYHTCIHMKKVGNTYFQKSKSKTECDCVVIKRGDIFYADLRPVVGSEQGGIRPVLIIQNDVGNRHSPTVICAAITSKMNKAKLPTHIEIDASAYGIEKDSVILLEQLRTIDKRRLKDKVCHLDGPMLDKVNHALEISLELTFS